ncbi:MAG TPA: ATP-binding protein [Rhodanobacteraceae bacterium]|nr:ATP-binding protein [Rhodanobacteraceae bacterium]
MIQSLRNRLTTLTVASIALVMLPLLAISYVKVDEEVNELSDARLAQSAKTLEALADHLGIGTLNSRVEVPTWVRPKGAQEATPQGHGYETQIGFQYWTTPSELKLATEDMRNLAFDAAPVGFADVVKDRRRWRVYTKIGDDGGFVRTAERYDSRREIARDLLLQNMMPLVIGLPLLVFLASWSVRRGLRPLADTARRIEDRAPDNTDPLDAHDAPDEIVPLVRALNGLLQRLKRVLESERQLTANAAHELRTPLAGALIHVENALAADATADRDASLSDARGALSRMTRLVNQMLELARWDSASAAKAMTNVDLAACLAAESASLAPLAAARRMRVASNLDDDARRVHGWEAGLRVLVRNLLDNALRYGAPGGVVLVEATSDGTGTLLAVSDDGPGIDAGARDAMFDRFQRGRDAGGEGVGLGLAIVKRIGDLHRASVRLTDVPGGRGLRVEVRFPAVVATHDLSRSRVAP